MKNLNNFENFLEAFHKQKEKKEDFAVVTLVHHQGSAPQDVGARCLVNKKGLIDGTVGGGKIEAHCIEYAKKLLNNSDSVNHLMKWNLQTEIGMTCGGEVSFFFEIFKSSLKWKIAIFGAGHVAQALTKVLMELDCDITVIDHREEWIKRIPKASNVLAICCNFPERMANLLSELHESTYICIMTMGHKTDFPVLLEAFKHSFPYVGNMGSDTKAKKIKNELEMAGVAKENLKNLHCPIGEEFGTNQPQEIAISIAAQLIKIRDLNSNLN